MRERGKTALVVGGGPAGLESAVKIGQAGYRALLVEKEPTLGGYLGKLCKTFPRLENPHDLLDTKIGLLEKISTITVLTDTTVSAVQRKGDTFTARLTTGAISTDAEVEVEAVVLATGFDYYDVSRYGEYGYGVYPGVMNSVEFEARLKEWSSRQINAKPPGAVAFIQCVGSRDPSKGYPYCSKICCMYSAKQAFLIKELFPETNCYVFYMDYRAAGKEYEEFVRSVIEQKHVRYVRGRPAKVFPNNGRLEVRAEDTLMGSPVEVEVDMVILAGAIIPREETIQLAQKLGVATDNYGFLEHEFGSPATAGDGIFFAGGCGFAVEIQGALEQGAAAAAEVIAFFSEVPEERN